MMEQTGAENRIWIALFRGINVGGRNILPMISLREILSGLGYTNPETLIQSGNAVFDAPTVNPGDIALHIASAVENQHGFLPRVLVLDAETLRKTILKNPFDTSAGKALHLYFMFSPAPQPDMERLLSLKSSTEDFRIDGDVLFLHAPDGIGRSRLAAGVEQCLGVPTTARNWNTLMKLNAMISGRKPTESGPGFL